ncbi:MAG: MarR family transcriptional regulator [Chloroflexi bacterium]|nr:MarR family transcriptional regulator [Chloroflexota bacterium]
MTNESLSADERLLGLFGRLIKLGLGQNPLQDSRVTLPQLSLLDWIADSPGCSVRGIASGLDLTSPTVSVGVRRLEKAGLVERQPDPKDGRSVQFFLTVQGQALHEHALVFRRGKMRQMLSGLTSEETPTLLTLLEKAIDAVQKPSSE